MTPTDHALHVICSLLSRFWHWLRSTLRATTVADQWVIEWNAGYKTFYWVGDCEVAWGNINPTDGDVFKAIIYSRRVLAENDLPRAIRSRSNARIVRLP